MAGKLTIRRIGVLLPALSLMVLLLLGIVTVWCSLCGLPPSLIRWVEDKAATEGVYLKIGNLRLDPLSGLGLKADQVCLYPTADKATPWAQLGRVQANLNLSRLFLGKITLGSVSLKRGHISIPLEEAPGINLNIRDIAIQAAFRGNNHVIIRSGTLCAEGITVNLSGHLQLPSREEKTSTPFSLEELVTPWQHELAEFHSYTRAQHWVAGEYPQIRFHFEAEGNKLSATCKAAFPRFDTQQFHFRDATLDLSYQDNTVIINSLAFRTKDPHAQVSLQGGYDLEKRDLSINLRSTAALTRMIHAIAGEATPPLLLKFSHPDQQPPEIRLQGTLSFEKNWTLNSASLRGQIQQEDLLFGSTPINHLHLSFFYDNGNFNIDHAILKLPDGEISASASARDGIGRAQLQLDLTPEQMLQLISEFTESEIQLPEQLSLDGKLQALLNTELTAPSLVPGQQDWNNFVPSLRQLNLQLSIPGLSYQNGEARNVTLSLALDEIKQRDNLLPEAIGQLQLQCSIGSLKSEEPDCSVQNLSTAFLLKDISIPEKLDDSTYHIARARGHLEINQANSQHTSIRQLRLELEEAVNLNPLAPLTESFETVQTNLDIAEFQQGQCPLKPVSAVLHADGRQDTGTLSFSIGNGESCNRGQLTVDWNQPELIQLRDLFLHVLPSEFDPLLRDVGIELKDILLPHQMTLRGALTWNTRLQQLQSGLFHLEIPELIRTPHRIPAHVGKKHALQLVTDAQLSTSPQGDLLYKADLTLTHEQGTLSGTVDGNLSTDVRFTGSCTLPLATLDELIDQKDAHSIMRDFRQTERSRTNISQIDTTVNYSNGISVNSRCDVRLEQTEYLLSAIEDKKDTRGNLTGQEFLRSDLGNNPYTLVKEATCEVVVQVLDGVQDASGFPIPNEATININRPKLLYDNSPWFSRQGFKTGKKETILSGEQINIDIEHSYVELKNVEGTIYPAYSLGMFYDELYHYLEDLVLPSPATISTNHCLFPIYNDCKRPMSGVIRVLAPGDSGFRFLGTTIPLRDFSGFINLTDHDVYLDRMNALSWGGVLNASVNIHIADKRTGFDGYACAQNMNLKQIAASYGATLSPALCNGEIRFQTPTPEINDLRAYGKLEVKNGDLLELSLFQPVGELITDLPSHFTTLEAKVSENEHKEPGLFSRSITKLFATMGKAFNQIGSKVDSTASRIPLANHFLRYDLQSAYTLFTISNGHLYTSNMKAKGYNLNVGMKLDIDLETLDLRGNLWPKVSSIPTLVAAPLTFLSNFMIDIVLYGKVNDIQWKLSLDRQIKTPKPRTSQQQTLPQSR